MSKLAIRRIGPRNGYGNVGQALAASIQKLGIEVVDPEYPAAAMLWVLPPHFQEQRLVGQHRVIFTMWESDTLPEGLRAGFPNWHTVIAPTWQNAELFKQYHDDVRCIPIGVDWRFWQPPAGRRKWNREEPFRILYTNHSAARKGAPIVRAAGEKLLREGLNVELVPASSATDEGLRDLYWSSHAYVQASSGEGWGMMPHQSLATGMPTILSDIPGHQEFGWMPGATYIPTTVAPSPMTFHGFPGNWWEPNAEDTASCIRWLMENYDEQVEAAAGAPGLCERHFDWDDIAVRVLEAVGDSIKLPDLEPVWEPAEFLRFPITLLRSVTCDIAEDRLVLEGGKTYEVTHDQKRVLREAGYVDFLA